MISEKKCHSEVNNFDLTSTADLVKTILPTVCHIAVIKLISKALKLPAVYCRHSPAFLNPTQAIHCTNRSSYSHLPFSLKLLQIPSDACCKEFRGREIGGRQKEN